MNATHIIPNTVRTLSIQFDLPLKLQEVKRWRGAFVEMAGRDNNLLHNHKGDHQYHHRYPRIQYRVNNNKASIFAFNEGIDAFSDILAQSEFDLNWKKEHRQLSITDIQHQENTCHFAASQYKLKKWQPFNSKNYNKWKQCKGSVEQLQLLEKLLANHLMASIWEMGIQPEKRVDVQLQNFPNLNSQRYHEARMLTFDLIFSSNFKLPVGISIGKGTSHGMGVINEFKK